MTYLNVSTIVLSLIISKKLIFVINCSFCYLYFIVAVKLNRPGFTTAFLSFHKYHPHLVPSVTFVWLNGLCVLMCRSDVRGQCVNQDQCGVGRHMTIISRNANNVSGCVTVSWVRSGQSSEWWHCRHGLWASHSRLVRQVRTSANPLLWRWQQRRSGNALWHDG